MNPPLGDIELRLVMTPAPERLPHDFTVAEAARFLLEQEISGAPVVGGDGGIMSVISTTDLLRAVSEVIFADELMPGTVPALRKRCIGEVVQRSAITCSESTKLSEACAQMAKAGVHRVIVTREGTPVGLVSSLDVARLVGELGGRSASDPQASMS